MWDQDDSECAWAVEDDEDDVDDIGVPTDARCFLADAAEDGEEECDEEAEKESASEAMVPPSHFSMLFRQV